MITNNEITIHTNETKCITDIETSDYLPWEKSRIICVGLIDLETSTKHIFYNKNEKELMISFISSFNQKKFNNIIGYNIYYDLRFLFSRCLKYNINAQNLINSKITDILKILSLEIKENNYNKPGKLGEWTTYLFNKDNNFTNESIKTLFSQGKIDEIIAHNFRDLEATYQLWNRIQGTINGDKKKSEF